MGWPVLVFDIETIPDVAGLRALGLGQSAEASPLPPESAAPPDADAHTWATWHVQNGTPLGVLQKLGGWADLRMVMNYAKFSADFVAEFVNNVRRKP